MNISSVLNEFIDADSLNKLFCESESYFIACLGADQRLCLIQG